MKKITDTMRFKYLEKYLIRNESALYFFSKGLFKGFSLDAQDACYTTLGKAIDAAITGKDR